MPIRQMVFVLCTVNRTREVEDFLNSLSAQDLTLPVRVVMVDQNDDARLLPLLDKFAGKVEILRVVCERGLSRARNAGLAALSADTFSADTVIAFPDDDCTYPAGLTARVRAYFDCHADCAGLSTLVTDAEGHFSAGGFMSRASQRIDRGNVWRCAVSPSIFLRGDAVGARRFDEMLGVGSGTVFGSGEETDYLLTLLAHGFRLDYCPELVVYHPRFLGPWCSDRGYLYGCGMGRVLRKQGYSAWRAGYFALIQLARSVQFALRADFARAGFHLSMSRGRIHGYFSAFPH